MIGEDILLYFGFGGNLSNWTLGSQVPIFHGVEGANVRRFQGIFDGPNPAAAFLLLYIPLYLLYLRPYKDYHYLGGLGFIVLFTTFIYTYSRSALLGAIGALGLIALFYGRSWIRRYPKQLMSALMLLLLVGSIGYFKYSSKFEDLVVRKSSTDGHLIRMINGWEEFRKEPM